MSPNQTFVFPDWQHNIVNLSATLAKHLGQHTNKVALPLLDNALQHDYQNVVFLVLDGMGTRIMQKHLPATSCLRTHQVQELTSVFPSTTTSATTTLLSALYPAEHGWFAWSLDFGKAGVQQLFKHSDFAKQKLPYQYFFANPPADTTAYALMPDSVHSKLDVENYVTYHNLGQMCQKLGRLCHRRGKKFIYAYFCDLDTVMHKTGTQSKPTRRLLTKIDKKLQKLTTQNPDTLFVITADHGQIDLQGYVPLYQDPAIMDCLVAPFSLDPRATAFRVKPDKHAQFVAAFQKYQDDFVLYPSKELIAKGVFGVFRKADYQKYLGDYIAVGTETNKMLVFGPDQEYWGRKPRDIYRGHHTSLTPDEMLVPLIIINQRVGK